MAAEYRHTQIAWPILGTAVVPLGIVAVLGFSLEVPALVWVGGVLLVLLVSSFSTLTVNVDDTALRFSFGVGLIGKTIPLGEVRYYAQARQRWYHGWGVRFQPGYTLYNVSGFDSIELILQDGRRLRVGTDEPEALLDALRARLGEPEPLSPRESKIDKRRRRRYWAVALSILVVIVGGLGVLFHYEEQPPKFRMDAEGFEVESFMYGTKMKFQDLTQLMLMDRFPPVRMRTNGYAAGRTLRGHFRLDRLGDGQLFLEAGRPPYVFAKTQNDYVIFNFPDPKRTQQAFEQIRERRREARR